MYPKAIPIPVRPASPASSDCQGGEPYALMVLGDSMQPEFNEGEIIVIEPEGWAKDGSYVIAMVDDDPIFRQLLQTDQGWQLKPLNPAYPTLTIADLSCVKGVVMLKKIPGKPREKTYYA